MDDFCSSNVQCKNELSSIGKNSITIGIKLHSNENKQVSIGAVFILKTTTRTTKASEHHMGH